jgi:hypothetical protein
MIIKNIYFIFLSMVSKNKFLKLPPINIYNNVIIKDNHRSIEHIIPQRIFKKSSHTNNIHNLAFTDKKTNSLRRDFKFGDIHTIINENNKINQDLFYELISDDYEAIYDYNNTFTGFISPSRRIFYPRYNENLGLLSRSIIKMLYLYPYLYSYLNEIVTEPILIHKWNQLPLSKFEIERNKF